MSSISEIREGLQIIEKYVGPDQWCSADHDELFAPPCTPEPEDEERLQKLHWRFDTHNGCWAIFV